MCDKGMIEIILRALVGYLSVAIIVLTACRADSPGEYEVSNPVEIPASILAIERLGGRVVFDFEEGFDGANPPEASLDPSTLQAFLTSQSSSLELHVIFVQIKGKQISNDSLKLLHAFPNLEGLSVLDSVVDDEGLRHIGGLEGLQRLWIIGSRIKGPGLGWIAKLPELTLLNLGKAPVNDSHLAALTQLKKLNNLTIGSASVTDAGVEYLSEIQQLQYLAIDGTAISGDALGLLQSNESLRGLSLGAEQLTSSGIEQLKRLQHLEELWVNKYELDLALKKSLSAARPDLRINEISFDF
jgi:Leucine-rich repeat (LRR) protein